MTKFNRREFLSRSQRTALGLAAGVTILGSARSVRAAPANDKVVMAIVGCKGRGYTLARNFASRDNCELAYHGNPGLIEQCQDFHKKEGEKYKTITNAMFGVGSALFAAGAAVAIVGAVKLAKSKKGSTEKPPEKTKVTVVPTTLFTTDSAYLGITGTF